MSEKPSVTIHYCTQCNWLLRAAWMAQELLHTFASDLEAVTLKPGTGGVFVITIGNETIWERKRDGGFPDAAALKQRVRDVCFPDRSLGHLDKKKTEQG
ncbi:SelT/SelW/SelH family protein [Candidatus Pantoea deserta]|uniref:SelT/SelW/SelH family protein n=1 Tax=Candidatus Pantoea deserta TaxID=1869313 RepID=A0A3N4P2X4_9GAMM|nr:SelT/SelW/SelH family protein [Pantoea deserta]RPD99306.1 SelT/SelW/SelH family protein [Pantoea deserta]